MTSEALPWTDHHRPGSAAPPVAVSPSPQDAYPPAPIALLVEQVGVRKATLPAVPTLALGVRRLHRFRGDALHPAVGGGVLVALVHWPIYLRSR